MVDAMKVKRSIYFATLQGYVIFETELYKRVKRANYDVCSDEIDDVSSKIKQLRRKEKMLQRKKQKKHVIKKVKVGNDQEMAQSERTSHSKNRGGEKLNSQSGTYTKKLYHKPSEQLFA